MLQVNEKLVNYGHCLCKKKDSCLKDFFFFFFCTRVNFLFRIIKKDFSAYKKTFCIIFFFLHDRKIFCLIRNFSA